MQTKRGNAIAGRKITLSFIPATQADADLIASYLPQPNPDGSPITPEQLPTSLPGYLLNLKAELRVDGQVVATSAGSVTMGQALAQTTAFYSPGHGQWFEGGLNEPLAGEYHAIATDLQGVASNQLEALRTKLNVTKGTLEAFQANPTDTALIQNITKEDLSGDLLYSGIVGYFASVDGNARLAARSTNQVIMQRLPSFGAFAATVAPNYFFGLVRTVSFEGLSMDVDLLFDQVEAKDNDAAKKRAYLRQTGSADSAFEHSVPEQLFKDPAKPATDPTQPQAVSAVKAIAIASAQGQRIYTLNAQNQANHATILAGMNHAPEVKTEISNALAAGKEVTTHEARINVFGFNGSGYIILDPDSGTGAYKIEGGGNGALIVLSIVAAALGGLTDALLTKLRDPNSLFGPPDEILRSAWLNRIAGAVAVISLADEIRQTLTDDSISLGNKIARIVLVTAAAIISNVVAASIGAFFASAVTGAVLGLLAAALIAALVVLIRQTLLSARDPGSTQTA